MVKSTDISILHITIRSSHRCVWGTCETGQVLRVGVPGGFSLGSPTFAPPTDWPFSYERK